MNSVDLSLTESGDIYFSEVLQNSTLNFNFDLCFSDIKNNSLNMSFDYFSDLPELLSPNGLTIKFENKNKPNKYKVNCISNNDVLKARLKYAIKTSLGNLKDDLNFGSKMELSMHNNINNKNVLSTIESTVAQAISNIIINPRIEATPYSMTGISEYKQGVSIKIYDYNTHVLTYDI